MRRKVFGYDKTLEHLKKGNMIYSPPMSKNEYMIDEDGNFITIRYDIVGKLLYEGLIKSNGNINRWTRTYVLKED